ncbi:protein ECERIFERUM 26-like [Andrographis paniculata]|uniref:protein ECERIFERUM 26-like n=1 Tax=Andrographis paniculata TaxID=175694 RepID=UPI0021E8CA2C|nr:protein ECERIFERUM 26-like [Andrographis paniculata]
MVSPADEINGGESAIRDVKLSTVVPGSITGEDNTYQFTDLDLAMKLHYITTVHFYGAAAVEGLGIYDFKKPMFLWLQHCYPICGRIRRRDGGRPFIKCNDSGVRIVEADCSMTVAEWLDRRGGGDHHRLLVYHQPIFANDFGFTPLVFLQLTKFKCGGLCVGMRWAHFLGDAFSATQCINLWGEILATQSLPPHFHLISGSGPSSGLCLGLGSGLCRSLKMLKPLGDNWLTPNNSKLQMHTFHITQEHLNDLLAEHDEVRPFELISAYIWKSLAKIRGNDAKIIVTVRKKGGSFDRNKLLGNTHQMIGVVEAKTTSAVADGNPLDLAKMIGGGKLVDETSVVEKWLGDQNLDCVVYGSNLTFVNLEEVDLHGLRFKGRSPVFASISIGGVGNGGAVVVGPAVAKLEDERGGGRSVSVVLPECEVDYLNNELRGFWDTVSIRS